MTHNCHNRAVARVRACIGRKRKTAQTGGEKVGGMGLLNG